MSATSKAIKSILRYLRNEGPPKTKELVEKEAKKPATEVIDDLAGKKRRLKSNPMPAAKPLDYSKVKEEGKEIDKKAMKGKSKGETTVKYGKFGIE
jgi:hypothetical protein